MCNWVFAAPKNSPILKEIIDLATKRILNYDFTKNIKGDNFVHFLTGPGCFTDGFEMWLQKEDMKLYEDRKKYSNYKINKNIYIYDPDIFHKKYVLHYFSGMWDNGWCKKRFINKK